MASPGASAAAYDAELTRASRWLRLALVVLIGVGGLVGADTRPHWAFWPVLAGYAVLTVVTFALWRHTPVPPWWRITVTGLDVAFITALAALSGAGLSPVTNAYFLIPVASAFRYVPALTAAVSAATTAAYLALSIPHLAAATPAEVRHVLVHAGYLGWVGAAAILLSAMLARFHRRVAALIRQREHLLADAMSAEDRERQALAEALHDDAIQNLLAARQDLQELPAPAAPAVASAENAITRTVAGLRDAVFELHPYVLDEAGLPAALRRLADRTARRAGVTVDLRLDNHRPDRNDRLLFSVARELLANAARHARATRIELTLGERDHATVLTVADDGRGIDTGALDERLADGHIGLASHRVRVESAGGRFDLDTAPGAGTRVVVSVPR
jgi:two-component system NarL family sensor kinase